jgi:uncharacterized protein YggE
MSRLALYSVLVLAAQPIAAPAQSQRAGSDRKTIEITATEKVLVAADIATIKIGYQNLAAAKDAAYAENTRTANKIIKAILDAGVPKEAIETESLKLEQEQERYGAKSDQPAKYLASQEWQIHSAAPDAQKIVDIAIAAGANQIESVEWSVKDPDELEAKAYAAALSRAKSLGEQTASNTGLKLGEIISIANSARSFDREFSLSDRGLMYKMAAPAPPPPLLELQPGRVEREASVTITYSVAP